MRPTSGTATFDGRPYAELADPVREVGTLLEATGFHPGRRARDHLRVLAVAARLPQRRGPTRCSSRSGSPTPRAARSAASPSACASGSGLAAALLGDPPVLVLDEPANGLDPQGIRWLRTFLRQLAAEGRTVLVSSHVLPEVEQTADDVLVLARGRLVQAGHPGRPRCRGGHRHHRAQPRRRAPGRAAHRRGAARQLEQPRRAARRMRRPKRSGELAAEHGVVLHRLPATAGGLEDVFLQLTGEARA